MQPAASVPAPVRREGRGRRVRPPDDPDPAHVVPGTLGDPPPAPRPAAPPARPPEPPRGLRPRPVHLPVLRPPGPRPDPRPRRPPPSRRQPHVGEPRDGVQGLQPPQGRPHARTRHGSACSVHRTSRAATSTRSSPRTSPTTGTRRGAATSSWARADGRPAGAVRPADRGARDPRRHPHDRDDPAERRARGAPRRRLRPGPPAGCRARRLGRRHRRAAGSPPGAPPRGPLREPLRDGGRAAGRRRPRGHDVPARRHVLRPSPPRRRHLRRLARGGPRPPRLHDQRDGDPARRGRGTG